MTHAYYTLNLFSHGLVVVL